MRLCAGLLYTLVLSIPSLAMAQEVPDAAMLQRQLRGWFATLLAPAVSLPEPPLVITKQGDRFHATLPLGDLLGPRSGEVTADLRPLDAGRWAIEQLQLPATGAFTLADAARKSRSTTTDVTFALGAQTSHGVIDPTLASPSSFELRLRDIVTRAAGGGDQHEQRVAQYITHGSLAPRGDGRLDLSQDVTVSDWKSASRGKDGSMVGLAISQVHGSVRVEGMNRAQWDQTFAAVKHLLSESPAGVAQRQYNAASPEAWRAGVRALLVSLRDLFTRIEGQETLRDITVEVAGLGSAALRQVSFGMGGEAPDGRLHAWLDVAVEGPSAPNLPPNLTRYLPSRLALRPSVSGVSVDQLYQFLLDAMAESPDNGKLQAAALALLSDSGVNLGLESLSLELAPLRVEGTGRVRLIAPDKPGLEARLSAAGMDALIAEVDRDPALQAAMPFLVMARGLGRAEGDHLVWDLAVTAGQALVNGVDVKKLGQSSAPAARSQGKPHRH